MILVYLFTLTFSVHNTLRSLARQDYIEAALWALGFAAVVVIMYGESERQRVTAPKRRAAPKPRPRPKECVPYYDTNGNPRNNRAQS